MSKKEKTKRIGFFTSLWEYAKTNRVVYIIFITLNIAAMFAIIRCVFERRPSGVFVGILAMLLLLIPPFVKKSFKVELPTVLESIAYIFVFCAQILGEMESFYTKLPFWDTMLHTVCGFIFAAFGFCLFDIFNRNKKPDAKFELSPFFLALLAFCFSMTIGILWEFFEFFADFLVHTDMQKDTVISGFGTINFDPDGLNKAIDINGIEKTLIYTKDGKIYTVDGYLDIGIYDTVKDLFVNFIGAFVFSIFGYLFIKARGKGVIANQFIPVLKKDAFEEKAKTEDSPTEPNNDGSESEQEETSELQNPKIEENMSIDPSEEKTE